MTFEAELRRALAPLAGDPDRDARRVLAALEQAPRPRLRPFWFPVLLAAAALAGFALGFLLRPSPPVESGLGPGAVAQGGTGPTTTAATRPKRPVDALPDFGPQLVVATGPVRLAGSPKPVAIGTRFALGDEIETGVAAKAAIALPCGSLLLANRGTRVAFPGPRQLDVRRGQVLVDATKGENPLVVRGPQGRVVMAEPGEVDIRSDDRELAVSALNQVVRLETNDGVHRRVQPGQAAWILEEAIRDPRMGEGPIHTAHWAFDLLVPAGRTGEADWFIENLLAQHERPYFSDLVPLFRGLALYALPRLFRYLEETRPRNHPKESRMAVMHLIADTADRRELERLFEHLDDPEPSVRAIAAFAIYRITQVDSGASKELWLEGDPEERRGRIERWKARVLR